VLAVRAQHGPGPDAARGPPELYRQDAAGGSLRRRGAGQTWGGGIRSRWGWFIWSFWGPWAHTQPWVQAEHDPQEHNTQQTTHSRGAPMLLHKPVCVGARAGLGEGEGRNLLARRQVRQVLLLLCWRANQSDALEPNGLVGAQVNAHTQVCHMDPRGTQGRQDQNTNTPHTQWATSDGGDSPPNTTLAGVGGGGGRRVG
jgi:hypothetical protein